MWVCESLCFGCTERERDTHSYWSLLPWFELSLFSFWSSFLHSVLLCGVVFPCCFSQIFSHIVIYSLYLNLPWHSKDRCLIIADLPVPLSWIRHLKYFSLASLLFSLGCVWSINRICSVFLFTKCSHSMLLLLTLKQSKCSFEIRRETCLCELKNLLLGFFPHFSCPPFLLCFSFFLSSQCDITTYCLSWNVLKLRLSLSSPPHCLAGDCWESWSLLF